MTILIGMDEAGYGPNLGPLCVAASVWKMGSRAESGERRAELNAGQPGGLYERLAGAVSHKPDPQRIAIADSKTLYKPRGGLRLLERGVFAALIASGEATPTRLQALLTTMQADDDQQRLRLPWHADFDCPLPIDATVETTTSLGQILHKDCRAARIEPTALRARLVFPREFNDMTDQYDSKGAALSHVTLAMLKELIDARGVLRPNTTEGVTVVCDKHGGRNRYGQLLQHHFPAASITVLNESRSESRYQWTNDGLTTDICFRTKGESFLPTALASMTAKYLRELAMRAFNQFWCRHLPDLIPTAGYPVDAKRFKSEINAVQHQLGIADRDVWRNR